MLQKKSVAVVMAAVVLVATVLGPLTAQAKQPDPGLSVPINTSNFTGTLTINSFSQVGNQVMAQGTVVGTTIGDAATAGTTFVRQVSVPVENAISDPASCQILTLVLGPLHLDLLGLVVDLNQVVLNITAQPGAGNLLGNLLCSLAGLLDQGGLSGALKQIVDLLNQILAAL